MGAKPACFTYGFIKTTYASQDSVVYIAYENYIAGVGAQTGEPGWRRNTGNWVPSLLGVENTVCFGAANTIVYAYDAVYGELVWQYNIPEEVFNYVAGARRGIFALVWGVFFETEN